MRIAVGSDHAGFPLKQHLAAYLSEQGHAVSDLGTHSEESVDYPDYAAKVARAVAEGVVDSTAVTVSSLAATLGSARLDGSAALALESIIERATAAGKRVLLVGLSLHVARRRAAFQTGPERSKCPRRGSPGRPSRPFKHQCGRALPRRPFSAAMNRGTVFVRSPTTG